MPNGWIKFLKVKGKYVPQLVVLLSELVSSPLKRVSQITERRVLAESSFDTIIRMISLLTEI